MESFSEFWGTLKTWKLVWWMLLWVVLWVAFACVFSCVPLIESSPKTRILLPLTFLLTNPLPFDVKRILLQLNRSKEEILRAEGNKERTQKILELLEKEGSATFRKEVSFKGPLDVIRKQKLKGLYRGLTACSVRESLFAFAYFPSFEFLKRTLSSPPILQHILPSTPNSNATISTNKSKFFVNLLSGGLSGMFSWLIITPIDVVKSKMQSEIGPHFLNKSILDVSRKIYINEGFFGFFSGLKPILLRALPVHATVLSLYTFIVEHFWIPFFFGWTIKGKWQTLNLVAICSSPKITYFFIFF